MAIKQDELNSTILRAINVLLKLECFIPAHNWRLTSFSWQPCLLVVGYDSMLQLLVYEKVSIHDYVRLSHSISIHRWADDSQKKTLSTLKVHLMVDASDKRLSLLFCFLQLSSNLWLKLNKNSNQLTYWYHLIINHCILKFNKRWKSHNHYQNVNHYTLC